MGNLAYMLEAAHFDLYSLWHWMMRFIAAHPRAQMAYRACTSEEERQAYAEAIVHETLRLEQSELLYWRVSADIVFEGFLIPRGTTLRICIWEGHKDAATFPEPFAFRPERFVGAAYPLSAFAPFGLGSRRCLGAKLTIDLSSMLVRHLLNRHSVDATNDGDPVMGPYHWQPGPAFALRMSPGPETGSAGASGRAGA
jgi:cytochrome P450